MDLKALEKRLKRIEEALNEDGVQNIAIIELKPGESADKAIKRMKSNNSVILILDINPVDNLCREKADRGVDTFDNTDKPAKPLRKRKKQSLHN